MSNRATTKAVAMLSINDREEFSIIMGALISFDAYLRQHDAEEETKLRAVLIRWSQETENVDALRCDDPNCEHCHPETARARNHKVGLA